MDIGDGVLRKLPFNNGGNTDEAANRFCARENLSRAHLEQIKTFITTNSLNYGTRDTSKEESKGDSEAKPVKTLPVKALQFFDAVKIANCKEKILEFNEETKMIDEKHFKNLNNIVEVVSDKSNYHSSKVYKTELEMIKRFPKWPMDKIFPVLDLFRMFLVHPQSSELFKVVDHGAEILIGLLCILQEKDIAIPNHLLSLRCIANVFKHPSGIFVLESRMEKVMNVVIDYLSHENKNI